MTLHLISLSDLSPSGDTPPLVGGSGFIPAGYLPAPATIAEPRTQAKAGKGKIDLYQSVTDSIIIQLEAGAVPWVQPWGRPDAETPFGLPTNGDTGNAYSGINILLLWGAAIETERTTQVWLTYKQAKKLGGQVRKGESGTTICYASSFISKNEKLKAIESGTDAQSIGFLKKYTVFNADQCEGLSEDFFKGVQPLPEREAIPQVESLIAATGADFRIGGDRAFFAPTPDFIQVPPQQAFFEQINYYRTCFHELGHWTGHEARLDRNLKGNKGSKDYAREELVVLVRFIQYLRLVSFVPNDNKKGEKSPDYFVKSGRCDLGVAWNETSEPEDDREPVEYISVKFDGPEMEKPFNAALFDREDGADLVWTRPKSN